MAVYAMATMKAVGNKAVGNKEAGPDVRGIASGG
jgi:hypothetical protein